MLALVPLLVPAATAAATGTVLLIMLIAIQHWWLPQQPSSTTPRFHYFTRLVKYGKRKLSDAVRAANKKLVSALSNAVAARAVGMVRALDNATELVLRTGGTFADQSEQIYRALYALRHVTVPAMIAGATRDILRRLGVVEAVASATQTVLTQVSTAFADGLRALPWGVPQGLPNRVSTFFVTYKRLWDQVWDELSPRVTALWTQIVPELRQRIEALERGAGGVGQGGLNAIRNRLEALEEWRSNVVMPRLTDLQASVDILFEMVSGQVGESLTRLFERVAELEAQMEALVGTGVATLAARVLELERALREDVEARLRQLELQMETVLDQVFGQVAADLSALIGRIVAIEQQIETVVLPELQRISALLEPAAFAAAVAVAMRNIAPNLFCRNVTTVTQRVCATDEAFWQSLLAGTLIFGLALDPRIIARAGQEFTEGMSAIWRETALR